MLLQVVCELACLAILRRARSDPRADQGGSGGDQGDRDKHDGIGALVHAKMLRRLDAQVTWRPPSFTTRSGATDCCLARPMPKSTASLFVGAPGPSTDRT